MFPPPSRSPNWHKKVSMEVTKRVMSSTRRPVRTGTVSHGTLILSNVL